MNKTAIRNFAIWARNKLIADVSYKAGLMGITKDGIADKLPQSTVDVEFYDIGTAEPYAIRGEEIKQRKGLVQIIKQKEKESDYETAYNSVIEEVAYTWFNRLIAVRFMEVNDYMPSHVRVLSSETGKLEPDLVTTPFDAELDFSDDQKQDIVQLKNDNKLDEAFRMLFIKQCNCLYAMLPRLFENTSDYSELLLNVSFIDQDGVVYHLVHDIDEDDFNIEKGGQVEIIGWLYQYYNAELKDETFALLKTNVKVTKERIPSATQLFTPDWIVRYMVENSLGRLWVEGHPNNTLKSGWKYYLEEAKQEENVKVELDKIHAEYAKLNPEDIKVIDPCMGSGHILVYAFDVLMQIYESAGYTQRDAARSIIKNNLFGLDIDERAAQLAYFAVLMKARQYNRRILDGETDCNVYAIKESNNFDRGALVKLGDDLRPVAERLLDAFIDSREYGSIITVNVTLDELNALEKKLDDVDGMSDYGNLLDMMYAGILCTDFYRIVKQARVMVQKYHALITNPPYMGSGNMNEKLLDYVKTNYQKSKADISTVFMQKAFKMCARAGYVSMINIPAWMFLSSFEQLRLELIEESNIINMLHFGRGIFGADFGTTAFVMQNAHFSNYKGEYRRLFDKPSNVDDIETKEKWFFEEKGKYYSKSDGFKRIPGNPIAYWVSENMMEAFEGKLLADYGKTRQGFATGDNDHFLYIWNEVPFNKIGFEMQSCSEFLESGYEYAPCNKGGDFRKWYGNNYIVCKFNQKAYDVLLKQGNHLPSRDYYFKKGLTWSALSIGMLSMRYAEEGYVFETKGSRYFSDDDNNLYYLLGVMNSVVAMEALKILCPTVDFHEGPVSRVPILLEYRDEVKDLVIKCLDVSKKDWDSYEVSWNFMKHPLV